MCYKNTSRRSQQIKHAGIYGWGLELGCERSSENNITYRGRVNGHPLFNFMPEYFVFSDGLPINGEQWLLSGEQFKTSLRFSFEKGSLYEEWYKQMGGCDFQLPMSLKLSVKLSSESILGRMKYVGDISTGFTSLPKK
jgi:hypothetical protein